MPDLPLSLSSHSILSSIFAKEIHSNSFAFFKEFYFFSALFLRKLLQSLELFIISIESFFVMKDI